MKTNISVYTEKSKLGKLKQIAYIQKTSVNSLLNTAIDNFIKSHNSDLKEYKKRFGE